MTFLRFSARQGLNASRIAKTLKYATIGETPSLTDPRWYWWWVLHDHREQFHRVQAEPEIHEKRAVIQQSAATETGEEGGERVRDKSEVVVSIFHYGTYLCRSSVRFGGGASQFSHIPGKRVQGR